MTQFIIYLILTVSGLTLFKLGSNGVDISLSLKNISINITPLAILGMACYMASFLLWLNIVKNNELGVVFPIATGIVTILTFVMGVMVFDERITMSKVIALAFIVIGVVIMNIRK